MRIFIACILILIGCNVAKAQYTGMYQLEHPCGPGPRKTAPPGYAYSPGSCVPHLINPCEDPKLMTGLGSWLNAKIGRTGGPPEHIKSMAGLAGPNLNPTIITSSITCRAVLMFDSGKEETGTIFATSPDGPAPPEVSWRRDAAPKKLDGAEAITARRATIEKGATLFDSSQGSLDLIATLVGIVQANDFRCETVSAALPMVFERGYRLSCNKYMYTYDIHDKGGHWVVNVE